MAKIFISYRRHDSSDITGRIYDRLASEFGKGNVFKDVDSIPLGVDFRAQLNAAVSECDVLLAVIGPDWAGVSETTGQNRLLDNRDFVRIELEGALSREIPVVPLLVGDASMPGEQQLPSSLECLRFRNGMPVRADPDFHHDMDRLIGKLSDHFAKEPVPHSPAATQAPADQADAESPPASPVARWRPGPPAVGIDLGTTFSVISRLDEKGQPVTLLNAEGDRVTPSVVLFDGDNVVVGEKALKAMATEADRVAECSKRDVGNRVFHKVFDGKQYPPEVIEAWVLNKLRRDAAQQVGPFTKVVITVPAYFDEVRRKATQDAGYMAGFEVLDIINEPTAAAVAFGFQQGFLDDRGSTDEPRHILVYDLGGGTFDVTVMEIRGNEFVVLATDGDVRLGGYDWDQRLVDLVAESFIREHYVDPREDSSTAGKLWRECEDAKRTLSARGKASVACEYRGFSSRMEVSREQFEEATHDLLDRTRFTTQMTLKAAGLHWDDIERVLLVGGATRMPMVRDMLRKLSGKEPDASVAADEAVAHGAALRAGLLLAEQRGEVAAFTIKNVNSHSLGVVGIDPQTGRRRNAILIPRNTQLPATASRSFGTEKANQRSILVKVLEGEHPSVDLCTQIGKCSVRDLPPDLPSQYPVQVSFHYEANGRLKVRVTVPNTDRQAETEILRENSLSKEHLDGWRWYITGLKPATGLIV